MLFEVGSNGFVAKRDTRAVSGSTVYCVLDLRVHIEGDIDSYSVGRLMASYI
jgi:hypothetical protein